MRICGRQKHYGERQHEKVYVCRRSYGHGPPCYWSPLEKTEKKPMAVLPRTGPLTLAAATSILNVSLPEGDYSHMVKKVYINGNILMIEFYPETVEELIEGRENGSH